LETAVEVEGGDVQNKKLFQGRSAVQTADVGSGSSECWLPFRFETIVGARWPFGEASGTAVDRVGLARPALVSRMLVCWGAGAARPVDGRVSLHSGLDDNRWEIQVAG